MLSVQAVQVQFLVRELRSHVLPGINKRNCGGFSSREHFVSRDLEQNAGQVCRDGRVK